MQIMVMMVFTSMCTFSVLAFASLILLQSLKERMQALPLFTSPKVVRVFIVLPCVSLESAVVHRQNNEAIHVLLSKALNNLNRSIFSSSILRGDPLNILNAASSSGRNLLY